MPGYSEEDWEVMDLQSEIAKLKRENADLRERLSRYEGAPSLDNAPALGGCRTRK